MDNLYNLKAILHTAKTDDLPSSQEMLQMIRKFRSQKLRNKWLVIAISALLCCFIITVLIIFPFKMLTSYLGGALVIAGAALMAATTIKSLRRFYRLDDCSNVEFLAFIEQTRQNQLFYYQKTMGAVVALYSAGWVLYTYEPVHKYPLWFYSTYAVIIIYLAVMWFVVRPRAFKKDQDKLNAMRRRFENISNQLK